MDPTLIGGGAALLLLLLLGKKKPADVAGPPSPTEDGTPPTTHVVVSGDTLGDLAGRFYGSGYNSYVGAQIIATANPQYYSKGGQYLNCLCPGWVLNIPEATSDVVNQAHADQASNPTTWTTDASTHFPPEGCGC